MKVGRGQMGDPSSTPRAPSWASLESPQPAGLVCLGQPPRLPPLSPPRQLCQPLRHLGLDPSQPEELLVPEPGGPHCSLLYSLQGQARPGLSPAPPLANPMPPPGSCSSSQQLFSELTFLIHLSWSVVQMPTPKHEPPGSRNLTWRVPCCIL